jgi:hypothetical protein
MAEPIRARVTANGAPQAAARVILLDATLASSLASTETAADGTFELPAPPSGDACLLARLRGPVFGSAHRRADGEGDLAADAVAPIQAIGVTLAGDVPPALALIVAAETIPGFPAGPAEEWTYRIDAKTNEAFASWTIEGGHADLWFQEGWWRLLSIQAEGARSRGAAGARRTWRIERARLASTGETIEPGPAGIRFRVAGPEQLELTVAETAQE